MTAVRLKYYIDGLPSKLAMQSFYIGKTYIYVIQGQTDIYISRCKIDGDKAVYQDHMVIKGNGHTQALDYYKGYFISTTKPTELKSSKKWSTQLCRFKYKAGSIVKYSSLERITNIVNYRCEGCLCGKTYMLLRKRITGSWTARTYAMSSLMTYFGKKLPSATGKKISAKNFPYKVSVQGCAYINGLLYLVGGGIGNKPQLCILKSSGTSYNLHQRLTLDHSDFGKGTEVENVQIKNGNIYIGVNDKTKDKYQNRIYVI